jgi:hypothetical protein
MHDSVIVQTLLDIQNLLRANLSDDRMISCLRAVIAEPKVQDALERGSDTALCFVLRAAKPNPALRRRPASPDGHQAVGAHGPTGGQPGP